MGTCCQSRLFVGAGNPNSGPRPASKLLTAHLSTPTVSFVDFICWFHRILFYSSGWPGTHGHPVSDLQMQENMVCYPARSFCFCFVSLIVLEIKPTLGMLGQHFAPGSIFCSPTGITQIEFWKPVRDREAQRPPVPCRNAFSNLCFNFVPVWHHSFYIT